MNSQFGKFDCWVFWKNGFSARIPLDIPAITFYRRHGVSVDVVGEYK